MHNEDRHNELRSEGRLNPESDIDLLIVQDTGDSIFERVRKRCSHCLIRTTAT